MSEMAGCRAGTAAGKTSKKMRAVSTGGVAGVEAFASNMPGVNTHRHGT